MGLSIQRAITDTSRSPVCRSRSKPTPGSDQDLWQVHERGSSPHPEGVEVLPSRGRGGRKEGGFDFFPREA